jgi:hypothetical protein
MKQTLLSHSGSKLIQSLEDYICWAHQVAIVIAKPGKPTMHSQCSIQFTHLLMPSHTEPAT